MPPASLVWTSPAAPALDEPTNHPDIPSLEALEEALRAYPGSILMVTHDRYFLDSVADRLLVLRAPGEQEQVLDGWSISSSSRSTPPGSQPPTHED